MTEQDWLQATDPRPMLEFLGEKVSSRKLRLFAVACCHRIWRLLSDERSRKAVQVAERFADGLAAVPELAAASEDAKAANRDGGDAFYGLRTDITPPHSTAPHATAIHAASLETWEVRGTAHSAAYSVFHNVSPYSQADIDAVVIPERAKQTPLLRDIFGPLPFRPVTLDPSWLNWHSRLLVSMAQQMYDSRDFADMPVLADALEEAGCTDQDILRHCRERGEHVRGCWVVDLLLGKE